MKWIRIITKVECTWPADDVTIMQVIINQRKADEKRVYIGLNIEEIDSFIDQLLIAKAEAKHHYDSYAEYCDNQRREHE